MEFPLSDLLDEQECYNYLLHVLHPKRLCGQLGHPWIIDLFASRGGGSTTFSCVGVYAVHDDWWRNIA